MYGVDLFKFSIADHGEVGRHCSIHASKNDGGFGDNGMDLPEYFQQRI